MSQAASVEVVRLAFESFNADGIEGVLHLFAPDFEVTIPPTLSAEPDTYRGHDGIRHWFAGFDGYMEDVRVEAEELVGADADTVVGTVWLRARGTESGIEVNQLLGQVYRLRDGLIHRIEVFPTVDEAHAAAGLSR